MEDIRSDARTSSRLSPLLTRQPQEGGGNRRKPLRKPSRNSLDSVLKNRPNLYRQVHEMHLVATGLKTSAYL